MGRLYQDAKGNTKEKWDEWDGKASDIDRGLLFILRCNSDKIHKDLEEQTTLED